MLNDAALILNRNWTPIDITTVRDALCMLYADAARAVLPEDYSVHDFDSWASLTVAHDEPYVRTVRLRLKVPEVILLARYGGLGKMTVSFSRRNLYRRDRYTCQYCGAQPGSEELTIDHVVPRSRGGLASWTNCVLACVSCNSRKGGRTPAEARMRLRKEPVEPQWAPHISIPVWQRKLSWQHFISDRYWNVQLEA